MHSLASQAAAAVAAVAIEDEIEEYEDDTSSNSSSAAGCSDSFSRLGINSPTPSEAGLAQVSSCSSSSDSNVGESRETVIKPHPPKRTESLIPHRLPLLQQRKVHNNGRDEKNWRKSSGWKRVSTQYLVSIKHVAIKVVDFTLTP